MNNAYVPIGAALRSEVGAHCCAVVAGAGNRIGPDAQAAIVAGIVDIFAGHGITVEVLQPQQAPPPQQPAPASKQ